MTSDLGYGIDIAQIKVKINAINCFDFEFEPVENDRLTIYNGKTGADYRYFGFIYRDGFWVKGAYHPSKIPAQGIRVITQTIAEGRLTSNK